jgi:hypothetical protein
MAGGIVKEKIKRVLQKNKKSRLAMKLNGISIL